MIVKNDSVTFEPCDMPFTRKFGCDEAAKMVLDFKAFHPKLPFLYDTHQLADFLKTGRKTLFDLTNHPEACYSTVSVPKKSGGTRTLNVPNDRLKAIQRKILCGILAYLPVSKHAAAYHKGARLTDNAAAHIHHRYLLKLDLSDFFGSIRFDSVFCAAFNAHYFPRQIGVMLTSLCCFDDVLPQGAPTSPALSNLVMKRFDNSFGVWCSARGFSYTRYCDDIAVSGNCPVYPAYKKARLLLENSGFEINDAKTRFVTDAGRQTVTGLTVNEKLSVPSDYKRTLRQELYYAKKFGLENVIQKQNLTDYISGGKADAARYAMHLLGKLHFVLSVEPDNSYFRNARQFLITQL
ncbi:MAG: RNA-directed DNA polymerase [Ruminococcus sp.]|nr:RNA-directed DNA polymerase [Ruminococcus sp.]